jgi:hypothetical protein
MLAADGTESKADGFFHTINTGIEHEGGRIVHTDHTQAIQCGLEQHHALFLDS